jgi:hypothetical protein
MRRDRTTRLGAGKARRRARPHLLLGALWVACALTASSIAQAQDDPNATVEEQATTSDLDTDVTPVAKESDLWSLVHGAEYPETEVIDGSATSFDTDLFDVSFRSRDIGLAGGSACAIEPVQEPGESREAFGARVADCKGLDGTTVPRIPVLYRYHEPANDDPRWDRLPLPGDESGQVAGYVGSIAWIDPNRALIVGGTGAYPRREPTADGKASTDATKADPAGKARAWLYRRSTDSVEEIDLSKFTPDETNRAGMRGFTAVACYQDPLPGKKIELCFAGALGQMWEWREGVFNGKRIDAASPEEELEHADQFRYRVRDIKFPAIPPSHKVPPPIAAAVTSGCCSPDPGANTSRILIYHEKPWTGGNVGGNITVGAPRWFVREIAARGASQKWLPEDGGSTIPDLDEQPELPDSFYSLTVSGNGSRFGSAGELFQLSVIATPGGTDPANERPSVISSAKLARTPGSSEPTMYFPTGLATAICLDQPTCEKLRENPPVTTDVPLEAARLQLGTARLVSGSGDVASADQRRPAWLGAGAATTRSNGPDGVPDWAAGELRSTAIGALGSRGLAVSTFLAPRPGTGTGLIFVDPDFRAPTPEEVANGTYEPVNQDEVDSSRRSEHYLLPSYSVNSVEIVGEQEDGWMVGDHGAILRLSAQVVQSTEAASEPAPPRLGARRSEPLADRTSYPSSRVAAGAGAVPALGEASIEEADEPRMEPAGLAGGQLVGLQGDARVIDIAMSRDGSEGWTIGNGAGGPVLSRFDGVTWRECDPLGVEGVVEPDPACEALAPLRGYRDAANNLQTVNLTHMVRVPLENDSDPTNDDELEIVAFGGEYRGPETEWQERLAVVRFRDGRWSFELPTATRAFNAPPFGSAPGVTDLAFAAPDDGWLASRFGTAGELGTFRYNGHRWIECAKEPSECGSLDRLPERSDEVYGLVSAGERVYLFGRRAVGATCVGSGCSSRDVPLIIYRDPGGEWTDGAGETGDRAGFDPAFTDPATEEAGIVESLSVTEAPGGRFEGWAFGSFGAGTAAAPPEAVLMRLEPDGSGWRRFRSSGALEDSMRAGLSLGKPPGTRDHLQVTYPSALEPDGAFIGQQTTGSDGGRVFGFDHERDEFRLLDSGRGIGSNNLGFQGRAAPSGTMQALAPDGAGGFWAAVSGQMFHYTKRPLRPVFEETSNPFTSRGLDLRALSGGADGSVWAATNSGRVFRHDPVAGWEGAQIPGWDPGRVVTRASSANALAIGPDGTGVVVGEAGRIANLSAEGIQLDPAGGRSCALGQTPPCSTSRNLLAVDVAPDGSGIAAGERLSLLWRGPEGEFQSIARPPIASATRITGVSMPTPAEAYLSTDRGVVFRGTMSSPGEWSWRAENTAPGGEGFLSKDQAGRHLAVRDVEVAPSGFGYAVGDRGLVMVRSEGEGWRRLPSPYSNADLTSVALASTGQPHALIGGADGLVLTASGSPVRVARHAGGLTGDVVDLVYSPGSAEGSVDAWAGTARAAGTSRLLRYSSEQSTQDLRAETPPLPDAPPATEGELTLGAFGKSDCDAPNGSLCGEMAGLTTTYEVITERIIDELVEHRSAGGLDLAVQTGDAADSAGLPASSLADLDQKPGPGIFTLSETQRAGQLKHRRYSELVADELADRGVPLFAAIGSQDLSETYVCNDESCRSTKQVADAGENLSWREAFAGRPEPWGDGSDVVSADTGSADTNSEVILEPAPGSEDNSLRVESQPIDADGEGTAPEAEAEIGGANTHYALDAVRGGEPIARIVFVDTSLRSLQAGDPQQQPHELAGGQQRFLERMICREGESSSFADRCTRGKDQKAIVVSNTPSYSYGPGALTHTALDSSAFEQTMLRYDVDLVISGALGYNGLYYTLAPGIHEPCPGGEYPRRPPSDATPECVAGPAAPLEDGTKEAEEIAATPGDVPGGDLASLIPSDAASSSGYPTLIAAGAGGKFGPDGTEAPDGPAGQWHGYSLARLLPDGGMVVEQRPILDWIGLDAPDHAVRPKSRLALNGYGRSPLSTGMLSQETGSSGALHYSISTPAITHRYDLLLADPDEPWLACAEDDIGCQELHTNLAKPTGEAKATPTPTGKDNPCSPYLCLPSRIGVVDDQSGQVRAGDGRYPETFAIAMLSVDEKVATYPLVFKRSPSFVTSPSVRSGTLPQSSGARPGLPPPPPPPPGLPQIPQVDVPQIPPPPAIPQLTAATPPELQPPAPPAPPPPSQQPAPLDLSVAPPGVSISTPTALIQPPTPPVNPAPPGGARREARQRQAAAQKGGADGGEEGSGGADGQSADLADSPPSAHGTSNMTRIDAIAGPRRKPEPSFTSLSRERAGSGGQAALYGGGITLAALVLALGYGTLRPTPRRRPPEVPAPAFSRTRKHRGNLP